MHRLLLALALSLLTASGQAATITLGIQTCSTSNAATYATGSFTPAAGDLLLVVACASDTQATATASSSVGTTLKSVLLASYATNTHRGYSFIATERSSATSQTVTLDVTGDNATGACVSVARVAGMGWTGDRAIRQSGRQQNQAGGGTPAVALSHAARLVNPIIGLLCNNTNPSGMTPPSGFAERADNGYGTPATGQEWASIDSGMTIENVTWGSTSASTFGSIAIELDATCTADMALLGVGCK